MAETTKPCPNCDNFVLVDTPQCLRCGFKFSTGRVEPIVREPTVSDETSTTQEIECATCGATVREHLVRCWKCGSFMRPDIAERFEEMQERRRQVEFEPLPDLAKAKAASAEAAAAKAKAEAAETYALAGSGDREDDFDVDGNETEYEYDDDFEIDAELVAEAEPAAPPVRRGAEEAPPVRRGTDEAPPVRAGAAAPGDTAPGAEGEGAAAADPAGDALLEIAMQEEKEEAVRRKQETKRRRERAATARKRGRTSPGRTKAPRKKAGPVAGKYRFWMNDVPLHVADPKKVKPKPGVLAKPTQTVDLAFADDGLLVVSYVKEKASLFGKATKPEDARKATIAHLVKDGPLEELPAGRHWRLDEQTAAALPFEQPNEYVHETAFGGVPVFGEGRIAIRLPVGDEGEPKRFLVFTLSAFRQFAKYAGATFGPKNLGGDRGIPLADETEKLVCHYTDQEMQPLRNAAYYVADPAIELKVVGRRCQSCELVVSEDGRKKEKIGGKNGAGLAKAKCPKCNEKFGDVPLYERVEKPPARKKAPATA